VRALRREPESLQAVVDRRDPHAWRPGRPRPHVVGADARLATSKFRGDRNLTFDAYVLASDDQFNGRRNGAGGRRLDYPNDRWDVALNWKRIGEAFNAAGGFRAADRDPQDRLQYHVRAAARALRHPAR
jgi:hypothetical protein